MGFEISILKDIEVIVNLAKRNLNGSYIIKRSDVNNLSHNLKSNGLVLNCTSGVLQKGPKFSEISKSGQNFLNENCLFHFGSSFNLNKKEYSNFFTLKQIYKGKENFLVNKDRLISGAEISQYLSKNIIRTNKDVIRVEHLLTVKNFIIEHDNVLRGIGFNTENFTALTMIVNAIIVRNGHGNKENDNIAQLMLKIEEDDSLVQTETEIGFIDID